MQLNLIKKGKTFEKSKDTLNNAMLPFYYSVEHSSYSEGIYIILLYNNDNVERNCKFVSWFKFDCYNKIKKTHHGLCMKPKQMRREGTSWPWRWIFSQRSAITPLAFCSGATLIPRDCKYWFDSGSSYSAVGEAGRMHLPSPPRLIMFTHRRG